MLAAALPRFAGKLAKVLLESGPFTPHLFRSLAAIGYPMVCIDVRRFRAAGARGCCSPLVPMGQPFLSPAISMRSIPIMRPNPMRW
jgi:hypothetical protein